MWTIIRKYYWGFFLGIAMVFVAVVLKDMSKLEELKSLLRRKKVEDEVLKIKEVIAKTEGKISATEDELALLAERHLEEVGKAKEASEEEIYDYYKKFFNK